MGAAGRRESSESSTGGGADAADDLHLYSSMSKHLMALATLMAVGVAVGAISGSKKEGEGVGESSARGGQGQGQRGGSSGSAGGEADKVKGDVEEHEIGGSHDQSYAGDATSSGDGARSLRIGEEQHCNPPMCSFPSLAMRWAWENVPPPLWGALAVQGWRPSSGFRIGEERSLHSLPSAPFPPSPGAQTLGSFTQCSGGHSWSQIVEDLRPLPQGMECAA